MARRGGRFHLQVYCGNSEGEPLGLFLVGPFADIVNGLGLLYIQLRLLPVVEGEVNVVHAAAVAWDWDRQAAAVSGSHGHCERSSRVIWMSSGAV